MLGRKVSRRGVRSRKMIRRKIVRGCVSFPVLGSDFGETKRFRDRRAASHLRQGGLELLSAILY